MKAITRLILAGIIALGFVLPVKTATAMTVTELSDLQVIGHHFSTAISNRNRMISIKDTSQARYVVLWLSADLQGPGGKLFTNDFTIRYFHKNGNEDRAQCEAISRSDSAASLQLGEFAIGSNAAAVTLNRGRVYIGLVFTVEPDVETIELYRIGGKSVTYHLGSDRPYSVSVYTPEDSDQFPEAKATLESGGYSVSGSRTLVKGATGITIHYREKAESQAREISQRLMTRFGITPTLKKMQLIANVDISVWLGK